MNNKILNPNEWLKEQKNYEIGGLLNANEVHDFMSMYAEYYHAEMIKEDVIGFAEWLPIRAQPKSISKTQWVLNEDRKEYTTSQLYELYNQPPPPISNLKNDKK